MIPHNLFVKDTEVLFNIPYLGENVLKNEVHFINGIIADYAGKIHSDKIKILEDSMFVDLVNALNKSDAMKEPTFSIFHAISNRYPDQGTPEQLRRKYHMLVHGEDAQYSSPYYTPNIDGPNAMSVPFQKSIQSFKRLFCRRCFVYDCLIHRKKI